MPFAHVGVSGEQPVWHRGNHGGAGLSDAGDASPRMPDPVDCAKMPAYVGHGDGEMESVGQRVTGSSFCLLRRCDSKRPM
ncbi:hypothetical protein ABIA26_001657 [Sinorhizobium fredii]